MLLKQFAVEGKRKRRFLVLSCSILPHSFTSRELHSVLSHRNMNFPKGTLFRAHRSIQLPQNTQICQVLIGSLRNVIKSNSNTFEASASSTVTWLALSKLTINAIQWSWIRNSHKHLHYKKFFSHVQLWKWERNYIFFSSSKRDFFFLPQNTTHVLSLFLPLKKIVRYEIDQNAALTCLHFTTWNYEFTF